LVVVVVLVAVAVIIVAYNMLGSNGSSEEPLPSSNKVLFETTMGNILIELRDDMPITVNNFKKLVHEGVYDNTIFHRVVNLPDNLVIVQGGDPSTNEEWSGGTIPNIQDEFSENPENNKNIKGTIAMANKGPEYPNSGSSQFFINGEYNDHLDNKHPVFGDIIDGLTVVDDILNVETNSNSQPLEDVILIKARFVD
jgi:cyclophilin family peptidyl-prolyl cis-trans isomerase